MINVCPKCGEFIDKPTFVNDFLICNHCSQSQLFKKLPLFIITGPSGVGKSTIGKYIMNNYKKVIVLERDILWNNYYNKPENNYREYREIWLRLCKNLNQYNRPVALFGCATPDQFESCYERNYFSMIHYLSITCDSDILEKRLKSRPEWRNSGNKDNIKAHVQYNDWLKNNAKKTVPNITLIENTNEKMEITSQKVIKWIDDLLIKQTGIARNMP